MSNSAASIGVIVTERCVIRSPEATDEKQIVAMASNDDVRKYLGGPLSDHDAKAYATTLIAGSKVKHCWAVDIFDTTPLTCVGIV